MAKVRDYAKLARDIMVSVGEENIVSAAHCATRLRLALVNPDWASMAARIAGGESIKFLMFDMAQTTYTSSVLPPLFLVLVLSYLERFVDKLLPDILKALAAPFICTVIMVPATILIIGPISDMVANGIAIGYNYLYETVPAVAALIIGGFWQIAVIFGVHWGVTPMVMANFSNFGCDSFQAVQTCAVVAQAAACFGVAIKTRDKAMKNVSLSAGLTGVFGITEPAIYGVTLRLKKPFVAGCISGALGALAVAFFGSKNYVYAGLPSLLTTVNSISPDDPKSFPGMLIGCAISVAAAIILVQVIGCDEKKGETAKAGKGGGQAEREDGKIASETVKENAAEGRAAERRAVEGREAERAKGNGRENDGAKADPAGGITSVCAPLSGEVKPLSAVNDPTFSEGILGQGAAIIPSEGKLYAPFDCKVASVFDTKHAVCLEKDGIEMVLHIGLETVTLGGKYFTAKVKGGDSVKMGDLLIEFDLESIGKEFDTITPVLVTNAAEFPGFKVLKTEGTIKAGEPLLQVSR